jgi:hypothetical protein
MQQDIANAEPGSPEVNSQEYPSKYRYTLKSASDMDPTGPKGTGSTTQFFFLAPCPHLSAFSLAAFWKAANVSEAAARDLPPRARAPGVTGVPTRLDQPFSTPLFFSPYRRNRLISDIFKVLQTVKHTVGIQEPGAFKQYR